MVLQRGHNRLASWKDFALVARGNSRYVISSLYLGALYSTGDYEPTAENYRNPRLKSHNKNLRLISID